MGTQHGRHNPIYPLMASTGLLAVIGAGLAWIAYSRRNIYHDIPLTAALDGELKTVDGEHGPLACYAAGLPSRSLPPVLFIHSVNAAASSAEMRPLFDHYRRQRRVYALDLPGFGFSSRLDIPYTPRLYRDAINQFVATELNSGPVDAVALSLGCEFLALAEMARPEAFRSLTFISPTGLARAGLAQGSGAGALPLLRAPFWRRPLFDLLTSRASVGFFLRQSQRKGYDRDLANYAYLTSHQPGAEYAPLHFLAGRLFTPGIFSIYQSIRKPVLLMYGQGAAARYDRAGELRHRPNWQVHPFADCGDLVHFDDLDGVAARMDQFLAQL